MASNAGFAPAQYNLANAYLDSRGINKDEKKAITLYQAAADQGYPSVFIANKVI